ncbi:unnamed protein product [Prunus armeniaca]
MFFYDPTSNSTIQGEIRSEELNWSSMENEDIHLCMKITLGQETITIDCPESSTCECSLPTNDRSPNPCEAIFDSSHIPIDNSEKQDKDPPSHSIVPTDQSPENISEVTTPTRLVHLEDKTIGYQLPFKQNRGKPPNCYSPDIGKTSKYLIANHVSTENV